MPWEDNILFLLTGPEILVLNCKTTNFTLKRRIHDDPDFQPELLCNIPKYNTIVLSSYNSERLCAVSETTGQIIWRQSGLLDDKICKPAGVVYVPHADRLLMGDYIYKRILVLSPKDGQLIQTLPIQGKHIENLHLIHDQLLVLSLKSGGNAPMQLSYYHVSVVCPTSRLQSLINYLLDYLLNSSISTTFFSLFLRPKFIFSVIIPK